MKTIFMSVALALVLVSAMSMVSAGTLIAGKIYDSPNFETANAVSGANIQVTCNENLLSTTSLADGTYSVIFSIAQCPVDSSVTVVAEKDGISNSGTGVVNDYSNLMVDLYVGVINIALIPEFGFYVGAVTLMGALGVFFLVRRK